MSESSQFANYSNTVQRLADSVSQEEPREEQVTDDAANFEQQFLIGAALHAKIKATDKFVSMIKKSKKVQDTIGKSKDEVERLARKGFQDAKGRVQQAAKSLQERVVPPDVTPPAPPPVTTPPAAPAAPEPAAPEPPTPPTPAGEPEGDFKQLESLKEQAEETRDATNAAKQAADEEVENSTADFAASRTAAATAKQVSEDALRKSVTTAGGRVTTDATNARRAAIAAEKNRALQESRNEKALSEQSRLGDQAVQDTSAAERAGQDLENAKEAARTEQQSQEAADAARAAQQSQATADAARAAQQSQQASAEASDADQVSRSAGSDLADAAQAEKEATEAARLAKLAAAERDAKDVEEVSTATDEADPLGFLVTAAAAAATQLIGRKIKAHEMQTSGVSIPLSYTSTMGA